MAEYTGSDKRLAYLFINGKVISGYYYNGQMYKDSAHTELITGSTDCVYIDKSTPTLYLYNGSSYEEEGGGGGGGSTVTITPTLSTGTKIADYSIDGVSDSLYAPNGGGGATDLDDLTDVNITSPSDGQALLYDSTTGEWVNGTVQGGGGGSGVPGTAGVRMSISIPAGGSVVKTFEELGIVKSGYYIVGMASAHAEYSGGWKWIGVLSYSGTYTSNYPSSYIKSIDSYYTEVSMQEQAKTLTFRNTSNNWGMSYALEVLPLHPKIDLQAGVAITEEILLDTPTTTNAWLSPISVGINRNTHLMISVEVALSDSPQIRNTVYNFTMEELKNNELGSHYILIPNESISEVGTNYTHPLAYVCLDGNNFNIRIPDGNTITVNRITAIKKASLHTYSTTEQVVGTWIDGKPLYERVITFTGLSQQTMISPGTIATLTDEEVKRIEVYATIGSMAVLPSGNEPYRNNDNDQIFFNVTINANNVIRYTLKCGTNSSDTADGWIIIQYTKSTD